VSLGPSISPLRVRYADTDQMGVVYYANYFVWFEIGRTDLLRESGWSYREMEEAGVALPVIETTCQYRLPARYDDEIHVRTTGSLVSPVRLAFTYDVQRLGDHALLATGRTVHAAVDRSGRPCRLPERIKALFGCNEQPASKLAPHSSSDQDAGTLNPSVLARQDRLTTGRRSASTQAGAPGGVWR
jgi:acyl-CoA thioester hydrolase